MDERASIIDAQRCLFDAGSAAAGTGSVRSKAHYSVTGLPRDCAAPLSRAPGRMAMRVGRLPGAARVRRGR